MQYISLYIECTVHFVFPASRFRENFNEENYYLSLETITVKSPARLLLYTHSYNIVSGRIGYFMKSVDFMHKLCAKLRFDGSPNPYTI